MFKDKTSDLKGNSEGQAMHGFSQKAFNVAGRVLNAMKSALDMFTNMNEQAVKFRWVLNSLVSSFGSPRAVAGALGHVSLPVVPKEAFVAKDVTIAHVLQDNFRRLALVSIGSNQVIEQWQAIQRGQHDQFVAKVIQIPRSTMSITRLSSKLTVRLTALVAQDRNGFGIHQQLFRCSYAKRTQPLATQHLHQEAQSAGASIVLTWVHLLRELASIIGSHIAHILRLAWKRDEILNQHQRQQLTVAELRLRPGFPFQLPMPCGLVPVIHQHIRDCQNAYLVYTCAHWSVVLGWR